MFAFAIKAVWSILTHTSIAKWLRSLISLQTRSCLNDCINRFFTYCKGANLIFISGRGLAISSAKEGKSRFIYNLVKSWSAFWDTQASVHFMKILTVYTLNSHLLTLKAHNHKMHVFLASTKIFEASQTNSVDPDQSAPVGAVWSVSIMFAPMLMLNKHFQMQLFCWHFKD